MIETLAPPSSDEEMTDDEREAVELVMSNTRVDFATAVAALKKHDWDLVAALLELTP